MGQPPDETQHGKQKDGDADGFVDLVEAELLGVSEFEIGHIPAERKQGDDQEGGEPVKGPGNPAIS